MKENQRNNMKTMCSVALFTAVICILSICQIPLPSGVPITLQTFALALCGYVIGAKLGAISATLYLLLGLIGLPVYAGMAAGPGVLFGPTGGFIFGFIFLSLFCVAIISGQNILPYYIIIYNGYVKFIVTLNIPKNT